MSWRDVSFLLAGAPCLTLDMLERQRIVRPVQRLIEISSSMLPKNMIKRALPLPQFQRERIGKGGDNFPSKLVNMVRKSYMLSHPIPGIPPRTAFWLRFIYSVKVLTDSTYIVSDIFSRFGVVVMNDRCEIKIPQFLQE
jgi:hypothetical protein